MWEVFFLWDSTFFSFFELDTFFMGCSTFSACSHKGIALVTRCLQPWPVLYYSTNLNTMKYRVQSRKKQSLCQTWLYLSQIPWFILIGKVRRLQRHASGNLRQRKISIPIYPLISGQPLLHWYLTVFINCFIRSLIVSVPNGKKREDSSWGQMCACVCVSVCVEWCNVFF